MYGIRLAAHDYSVLELADLVAHLPPGCALWRASGGALAWSAEMHKLAQIEHGVRVLAWQKTEDAQAKPPRNAPKPEEPPLPAGQVREDEERRSEKAERSRARRDRRAARREASS